jgi:hypothetical protein
MTFGKDARSPDPLEVIAAFSQNCGQALDPFVYLTIVFQTGGEAMPARCASNSRPGRHFDRRR